MPITEGTWCPSGNITQVCQSSVHSRQNVLCITSESYPTLNVMQSTIKCRIHKIQNIWLISESLITSAGNKLIVPETNIQG